MFIPDSLDRSVTYYLAGPMSGYPEHNFPAFYRACEELRAEGISIVSPVELAVNNVAEVGSLPWEEYLRVDMIEILTKCKGVILLPGWPQSKGARAELSLALTLGFPVFYVADFAVIDMNQEPK